MKNTRIGTKPLISKRPFLRVILLGLLIIFIVSLVRNYNQQGRSMIFFGSKLKMDTGKAEDKGEDIEDEDSP